MNFDRNKVERVRQQYPVGTRIQLHSLCNDERDMPSGLCGTVVGVDDQPALLMKWDNGRTLSLLSARMVSTSPARNYNHRSFLT